MVGGSAPLTSGKAEAPDPGGGGKGKVNQAVFKNLPAGPRGAWRF